MLDVPPCAGGVGDTCGASFQSDDRCMTVIDLRG